MGLSKEQILAVKDGKIERVSTPEWGDDVYVRSLRGVDRESMAAIDQGNFFGHLIINTLCDESGASLGFTIEDLPALADRNLAVLVRIFNASAALNGIGATAAEAAKGNS